MFNVEDKRMSFTEHLGEFRTRLIRISISIVVTMILGFAISDTLLKLMQWPIVSGVANYNAGILAHSPKDAAGTPMPPKDSIQNLTWVFLTPVAPIKLKITLAMYFALLFSFPVLVYQICAFIFPGLKPNERNIVMTILGGSSGLTIAGVLTAYLGVLPFAVPMLLTYTPPGVINQLEVGETIAFILTLLVGFAIVFQLPIFIVAAVMMGIIDIKMLTDNRKYAIVGIAIISAIFTPPDVYSMTSMMVPLFLLYEISIIVARIVTWRRNKKPASTDLTTV